MFGFWNDSKKNTKYNKPNRRQFSDEIPRKKRANVELTEREKRLGNVIVEKKPFQKSGFWTESPHNNKSNMKFKKTLEDSDSDSDSESQNICELNSEISKIRSDLDLLMDTQEDKKINQLIVRLNQLEDDFNDYKEYVNKMLSLFTEALKEHIHKTEDKITEEENKDTNDFTLPFEYCSKEINSLIHINQDLEITLSIIDDGFVFPFGETHIPIDFDSDIVFTFDEGYVYGDLIRNENGFYIVVFREFKDFYGNDIVMNELEFPIKLTLVKETKEFASNQQTDSTEGEGVSEESSESSSHEIIETTIDEVPDEFNEIPNQAYEPFYEDIPNEEVIDEIPEEVIDETPEEVIDEIPEEVIDEIPEEVIDEIPEEVIDETPDEVIDEIPEEVIDETPEEVIDETPEEVIDETPDEVIDEIPEEVIQETPQEFKLPIFKNISLPPINSLNK